MSDEIKEMAKRLREIVTDFPEDEPELDRAADALEALAVEVERLRNEKVAGGPTGLERDAKAGSVSSPAPATDPAPAVASTPRHTRPYLTPLSAEAQQHRKPLSPVELVGALQDMPKIQIQAHPERFARQPIKFTEAKE